MARILSGAEVAASINEKLRGEVARLGEAGVLPTLAVVRVGERGDDVAYERGAVKRCESVGVAVRRIALPGDVSQQALLEEIGKVNRDGGVHGCLLLRPLPKHLDDDAVRRALSPEKDVDGITDCSMAGVYAGTDLGFTPCTPQACVEILEHYHIDPAGKRVVVVGRSLVVGKPAAMLLLRRNATVTVCHTRTVDLPGVCRGAEILIVSAGRAAMIGKEYLSAGQIVIDVGINVDPRGSLCGDVAFEEAQALVGAITPVPGGVGTVTTSVLVQHVVEAARRVSQRSGYR